MSPPPPERPVGESLGEVFTRRWVVETILDLAEYRADQDLASMTAVEPSCGAGAFLVPMVERLITSARQFDHDLANADLAIRAYDLSLTNVELARKAVAAELEQTGLSSADAERLSRKWVVHADFLLDESARGGADYVLGNPPYVRLEDVPKSLSDAYRRTCETMRGRSDLYVGFIEKGLQSLTPGGTLGFIVADRWMNNQYGRQLRSLVGSEFAVKAIIQMHETDAFEERVSAYPAITVLKRAPQTSAVLARATQHFGPKEATRLSHWTSKTTASRPVQTKAYSASRLQSWFVGGGLWPTGDPELVSLLQSLESRFPTLEDTETATRVGIGLASGADRLFLRSTDATVEPDRLMPMIMSDDLRADGSIEWAGTHLVNPWTAEGLVDLASYPLLRAHFEQHRDQLESRYIAKHRPNRWYQTIDRPIRGLGSTPKLLIPDLKSTLQPVLESGSYYPHHNLYHVTSEIWDLPVLGGVLISHFSELFIKAYCVKMRGGCYRLQAQYLRTIRVPRPTDLSDADKAALAAAFTSRDRHGATEVCARLFGLRRVPSRLASS